MINKSNYFDKYLKYKNKYLELKNLIGGNPNLNNIILIATHSYRLQCILNTLRVVSINSKVDIKRFKNCAVVRVYRGPNGNTCVQIIFVGIFKGPLDPSDTSHFEEIDKNNFILEISNPEYSIPENTEIYFIRHGEGEHNLKTIKDESLLLDAKLTEEGNKQAREAGEFLNTYFTSRNISNTLKYYFCASDLHRTRETIGNIKDVLNSKGRKHPDTNFNKIFVLSCLHEITPKEREKGHATEALCDNPDKLAPNTHAYNMPKCVNLSNSNPDVKKDEGCTKINTTVIDWSKYDTHRKNCASKNIIKEILKII